MIAPRNHGKLWTFIDYGNLKRRYVQGQSVTFMAKGLGRTDLAIKSKLENLGLTTCLGLSKPVDDVGRTGADIAHPFTKAEAEIVAHFKTVVDQLTADRDAAWDKVEQRRVDLCSTETHLKRTMERASKLTTQRDALQAKLDQIQKLSRKEGGLF